MIFYGIFRPYASRSGGILNPDDRYGETYCTKWDIHEKVKIVGISTDIQRKTRTFAGKTEDYEDKGRELGKVAGGSTVVRGEQGSGECLRFLWQDGSGEDNFHQGCM